MYEQTTTKRSMGYPWVAAILMITGCRMAGVGGNDTDTGVDGGTDATIDVERYTQPTGNADLDEITQTVINLQDVGENFPRPLDGVIQLPDGTNIALTELGTIPCPEDTYDDCNLINSDDLGIGHYALVSDFDYQLSTVKSQGSRPTCVSFGIAAGVETSLHLDGTEVDLSEQYIYLLGKDADDSWDTGGLWSSRTLEAFVADATVLVAEEYWPYNSEDYECEEYLESYPDSTCSETEAQGAGPDGQEPDPRAAAADGYVVTEAEQLYASVGRVKRALYEGHPVVLEINANTDFSVATLRGGVVSWVFNNAACGAAACGHAILAVGYVDHDDVDGGGYIIVKNSWGDDWGDDGLAYLTYEWLEYSILDAWAIVSVQ